jgi:hypothetical protein
MPDATEPTPDATPPAEAAHSTGRVRRVADRVADRVGDLVPDPVEDAVEGAVGRATTAVGGALGGALDGAVNVAKSAAGRWDERPGARVRRLRRRARTPLPYLYAVHPEARFASPREIGLETIDVDRIAGTAVGGVTQRGGDFLPLRAFRSTNWTGRWQRIRQAIDRLTVLPPIDVLRFGDRYWVLDGHNRVAAALYAGQVGIDANVVELVPPGSGPSERPTQLAPVLTGSRAIRTAGRGRRVASMSDEIDESSEPS